jgi:transcriptional regulator with XRE-family HTH domain
MRSRAIDLGAARAHAAVTTVSHEIDMARRQHGLSLEALGAAVGMSRWQVGRIARSQKNDLTIAEATLLLAALGQELSVRSFPSGDPVRDVAHLKLLERFRAELHASLRWRVEVPVAGTGDMRAWDAVVSGAGWSIGIEAETRIRDVQVLERRLGLKLRDGSVDAVVLLLADTRHHRTVVRLAGEGLARAFPLPGRRAIELLRVGVRPGQGSIVLL